MTVFLITRAYESNLLASLLAEVYEKPIDTFGGKLDPALAPEKSIMYFLADMLESGRPVWYTSGSSVVTALAVGFK